MDGWYVPLRRYAGLTASEGSEKEQYHLVLLGRMFKSAGKAMKNEVKQTVRCKAMKTARKIRKRIDNRGKAKPTATRRVARTTHATTRRPLKKLPKMKVRY